MIHQYRLGGYNIVIDVCSGAIHVVDEVAYDIISLFESNSKDDILSKIAQKYADRADISADDISECYNQVCSLKEQGKLFETYNIGGHNEKQNIEIINIIIETLQEMLPDGDPRKELVSKDLITYVEDRKGHDRRYAIAPDKIKAEIGWEPETMFKEGIKLTIKWFFENEELQTYRV